MSAGANVARWGGIRLARRLGRSVPFFGAVIAMAALGSAMRRKGPARGAIDTGLNAVPFVGAFKTAVELVRGRDLIPDRPARSARRPS